MAFSITLIDQNRYLTEVKAAIVRWLDYHLHDGDGDEGFNDLWANVGGRVDVTAGYPGLPPETEELERPRLAVDHLSDETNQTQCASGQYITEGAYHTITLSINSLTDENTGGPITADDLVSAVATCFSKFRYELEPGGIAMLRTRAVPEGPPEDGLYRKSVELLCDVQVVGENLRTIVLEMGRFTITALDTGTYTDGHELTVASDLRIHCLTGTRILEIAVTVYGVNADSEATTLTGTIPIGASSGTYVALTPATVGDTFTDVTNIEITGGVAGEIFVIENIPQEV